jgi:hypothetical protein
MFILTSKFKKNWLTSLFFGGNINYEFTWPPKITEAFGDCSRWNGGTFPMAERERV